MPPSTRIVMLGTGDFALPTFEHLCETGHRVVAADHPARPPPGAQAGVDPQPDQAGGARAGHRGRQPEDVNAPRFARKTPMPSIPTSW